MSKPVPVFTGSIDRDGKLHLDARGLFARYLTTLKNKPVQLVVKVLQRRKSQNQLGYLWGCLYPIIANEFGYADHEHDALHDALMRKLCGLKPEPNPLEVRVSMQEMSHEDVSAYIEDLRHWALTEHGIVTPDADKADYIPKGRRHAA